MNKRKRNNGIFSILFIFAMMLSMASCEDYLDKALESDISDEDVFGSYMSFQGFIEEMYHCIADPHRRLAGNWYYFAYFDDSTMANSPLLWDDGNYWDYQDQFLTGGVNTDNQTMTKQIWPLAWYAIRKANIALANLHLLKNADQSQRDAIEGQAYFFRGFFHLELMQYYGGLPYIDTLLVADEEIKVRRLNYKETALKVAKDLRKAADLLPLDWDGSTATAGHLTRGDNNLRASKIEALGYLGKNLLYAASPMMNESSGGTATYDQELCKQAAEAFAEAIKLSNESGKFKLEPWETRHRNFWVVSPNFDTRPGGTETIRHQMIYEKFYTKFTMGRVGILLVFPNSQNKVQVPTHNYVQNYGMSNGLPVDDPESGYDPQNPFVNRDPRFYVDIVVGGDPLITNGTDVLENRFARLHNGGSHKGGQGGSVTGYLHKKYNPLGHSTPNEGNWQNFQANHPRLRLADIYLMYAEAVLWGYGSPSSSVPGANLTALQAVNIIRNRAGMPDIHSKFLGSQQAFMEELIRERAVELAFEGLRWFDLRRWNVLGEMKYREKYALDYDSSDNGFTKFNYRERLLFTRPIEKKHNWVPFNVNDVSIYEDFPQNPGW